MHPDAGGRPAGMRALNVATTEALRRRSASPPRAEPAPPAPPDDPAPDPVGGDGRRRISRVASDVPSFTVEALPVEAFEALLVAAAVLGEVLDDDPPYRLDVVLGPPYGCWCRLDLVPEAGASSVSLTVGAFEGGPPPQLEAVRDAWIDELNALDWPGSSP